MVNTLCNIFSRRHKKTRSVAGSGAGYWCWVIGFWLGNKKPREWRGLALQQRALRRIMLGVGDNLRQADTDGGENFEQGRQLRVAFFG